MLTLGLLTGCMGQRDASEYNDDVRADFIAGCDGSAFADEPEREALEEGSLDTETCTEAYDCIEENVPFDDFKSVNSNLREDPGPMDPLIMNALDDCGIDTGAFTPAASQTPADQDTDSPG